MTPQQEERFRIQAEKTLRDSNGGKGLKPEAREWAIYWAARPPLGQPHRLDSKQNDRSEK